MSSLTRSIVRAAIRIITNISFVIIAILFPSFDSIMSFLGNALCFSICVVLPLLFYLKIFGNEVSTKERVFAWFLIVICSVLAVIGTTFAFIPKENLGISWLIFMIDTYKSWGSGGLLFSYCIDFGDCFIQSWAYSVRFICRWTFGVSVHLGCDSYTRCLFIV
jgi:hypothetical protein